MGVVYSMKYEDEEVSIYLFFDKQWRFSADSIRSALHKNNDIIDAKRVFEHLQNHGVCKEEEYIAYGLGCRRVCLCLLSYSQYAIDKWTRLNYERNQDLVNLLKTGKGTPVYVQLGLHPSFFQFHSPNVEDPITAGYGRPTFAGVLTGFNFTVEDEAYWEVYIRRHKLEGVYTNNYVRVGGVFMKKGKEADPFAGITSNAITIEVTDASKNRDVGKNIVLTGTELSSFTNINEFITSINRLIQDPKDLTRLNLDESLEEVFLSAKAQNVKMNLLDYYPNLEVISLPYEFSWIEDVFTDIFDIPHPSFYRRQSQGRRLAEKNKELVELVIDKGLLETLTFGPNTFPNTSLVITSN